MTNDLADVDLPAPIGHNRPRPFDLIQERVDQLVTTANAWLKQVPEIKDEAQAKRADDFLAQLTKEVTRLKVEKATEKEPHLKANKEIDARYGAMETLTVTAKRLIEPLARKWLQKKQAEIDAEHARKQEEAARKAREAQQAEEAARGSTPTVEAAAHAERAREEAEAARRLAATPPPRAQVRGSYSARARSVRTIWRAEVEDLLFAFSHYHDRPEVRECLTKLASADAAAAAREGREIPGCRLVKSEIAS
jgi:hypothetical protein